MSIWVDADACPRVIKEILFRAAVRTRTDTILVANSFLTLPKSLFIRSVKVEKGFDRADNYIVTHVQPSDLVVTADIPLAAEAIEQHACVLNPRGEMYTTNNIKQRLTIRDMNEQLRATGTLVGGPTSFTTKEKTAFANALDKYLTQRKGTLLCHRADKKSSNILMDS